jgi:hypothetical protein
VSGEVDELAFLFRVQASPDLNYLRQILGVDLHDLGVLSGLEGTRRGGHGLDGRRGWCTKVQLL